MSWALRPQPELSDKQFRLWQELLEARTGIDLGGHKSILQVGLLKRMRQLGYENYGEYYHQVSAGGGDAAVEWGELLNSLTVQETRFYRDPSAFAYLGDYLQVRLQVNDGEPLELWSVGCSTGEEAYSLAITAAEAVRTAAGERFFGVTGTDISSSAVARAEAGEYRQQQLLIIEAALRYRYFRNISAGSYQVVPALRSRVCFSRSNIAMINTLPNMLMDVIYCQNMLIYFKREGRISVLNALYKRLKPGGLLITGPGESQGWHHPGVRRISNSRIEGYIKQ
ncbi:type IV pilus assembly protein PilK [Sinobacterium caligoides]|uniref:protein-glutamate O-methyltransferase n=1 Tax=Sinobacterium caligoides TaxID=933926 RepID=A0A3N2DGN8_9GAMM|nr:protein-glutamate O-methyltransferase CheR [Sinobacterium caligoides]ROR98919.1 type IV pilus assembly protein PilK [Sinobacterium caligoides]